jgi:sialate O-acetylesterase
MRLPCRRLSAVLATGGLLSGTAAAAEVSLPRLFGDHMVLQRDAAVPVWGNAEPNEPVIVSIAGQRAAATAGADGRWRVALKPMAAGGPHELSIAGRDKSVNFKDVLVGEVWLCSGQSNMEWPLKRVGGGTDEMTRADYPSIRLFTVSKLSAGEPQDDCRGAWAPCRPETAAEFSGVAYHFGKELHARLKVPVGLVQAAWSGAAAESLIPAEALKAHPTFREKFAQWEQYRKDYPSILKEYNEKQAAWQTRADQAKAEGKPAPPDRPRMPKNPDGPERSLARLYNGMIHPVVPFGIRGVAFYQGENNVLNPDEYRELFPLLIREWRRRWGRGDVPFLFVQIANFSAVLPEPSDGMWCRIRDAQRAGLREPNTAMIVAIDLGDADDLHAKNKRDVGLRLARAARRLAYGEQDVVPMGPLFAGAEFKGPEVTIRFTHAGGGLVAKGGGPLVGFAVAGDDRRFAWAAARVDGDRVVVSCDKVSQPAAVRYAFAANPRCNLYNAEGLPASPFRTDDWPEAK